MVFNVMSIVFNFDFDRRSVQTCLCNILLFSDIFELEMATYTNKSLDKLYKKDLIPIVLSLQNKLDEANNSN